MIVKTKQLIGFLMFKYIKNYKVGSKIDDRGSKVFISNVHIKQLDFRPSTLDLRP